MITGKYKNVRYKIIKYIGRIVAILGFIGAFNGVLAIVVDKDSALGKFYEKVWYNYVLGKNFRENMYNPFEDGGKYIVYFDVILSKSDIEDIQSKSDNRVYTYSRVNTYYSQSPQGILTFAESQYEAFRISNIMLGKREPLTYPRDDGVEVTEIKATTIPNLKVNSLKEFCIEYRTFEPEQLCF